MQVKESVWLPLPPMDAWNLAQDPDRRPLWDLRYADYQFKGPPAEGVGIQLTVRMGLMRPKVEAVLKRWAPPHKSVVQGISSSSKLVPLGAGSWTFEAEGDGTRLTSRFTLDDKTLPSWVPRSLYALVVRLDTRRSFRRLAHMARNPDLHGRPLHG